MIPQNLTYSNKTLEKYLKKIFTKLIKKRKKTLLINFNMYMKLSRDVKIALINESVKRLKNNYYDLRSKKVENLIKNLDVKDFKKATLGGCIFFKKDDYLCLEDEKL